MFVTILKGFWSYFPDNSIIFTIGKSTKLIKSLDVYSPEA